MDGRLQTKSLQITPEILALVAEISEFRGAWRTMSQIPSNRLERLRRVATMESIGASTRIEGSRLSDREVEFLLSNPRRKSFATRDEQEVAGYAKVLDLVLADWETLAPTEDHIKQLHHTLLRFVPKDELHRGGYKTMPNHVAAFGPDGELLGVIFQTASPSDTPHLMGELMDWFRQQEEDKTLHPLLAIAVFVVVFLEIHPFQDGNGRLSRILTTLLLLRAGYSYVPHSSLESVLEVSRNVYYLTLRITQQTIRTAEPKWEPWNTFFLRALQRQKRHLEEKLERDQVMYGDMPSLSRRILDFTREQGQVTVATIVKATGTNRSTVKDHLKSLVQQGRLHARGAGRGAWYSLE